jgi:hypothetical protein
MTVEAATTDKIGTIIIYSDNHVVLSVFSRSGSFLSLHALGLQSARAIVELEDIEILFETKVGGVE